MQTAGDDHSPAIRMWMGVLAGGVLSGLFAMGMRDVWARLAHQEQVSNLEQVHESVVSVREATATVQQAVLNMAAETSRAQRLAVWVGVGATLLGAVIGGFAGAFAARLVS